MEKKMIYPLPIKKNDRVCLIDPANAFTEEGIRAVQENFVNSGLEIVVSEDMAYKHGTPKERAGRLNLLLEDKRNRGIFCLWGGYGTMTLLDYLNYDALMENRPVFAGLSDITAMHLAIQKRTGLVTYHTSFYSRRRPVTKEAVWDFLGRIRNPEEEQTLRNLDGTPMRTIHPGDCEGILTGGNLTLISRLMGTPYEVDTRGKILFLEEIGEKPYRLHGMLTQLKMSGKLDEAKGILLGTLTDCDLPERPGSAMEAVLDVLDQVSVPVIGGLRAGHISDLLTLPLGKRCRFQGGEVIV